MTNEQRDRVSSTDTRPLRRAIHDLADIVDLLSDELGNQAEGQQMPQNAQDARDMAQTIREQTPDPVAPDEEIQPPWEREGYDSKEAWLDDQ